LSIASVVAPTTDGGGQVNRGIDASTIGPGRLVKLGGFRSA